MSAVTVDNPVALSLPADLTFNAWLDCGRSLSDRHRETEWMIGDWYRHGESHFSGQPEFDMFADALGIEAKRITAAGRVAKAFPPHLRAADVSYEVHAYIATLPEERRIEALDRARAERWGERRARSVVTAYRQEQAVFEDEDAEVRLSTEIVRAWNRAPEEARRYFWELASRVRFGVIDEDRVYA